MSARGEDRKAAILDAAIVRIVYFGLEGLRVRDVAQDVGINNATLHHHFPTKTSLIAAIVQLFVVRFSTKGGVPDGCSLEERLAAYVATRRDEMRRDPATYVVLSEFMILARRDDEVRRLMFGMQAQWRDYLVAACREAGLGPDAALARAERCRHEIIGMGLDRGLDRPA